MWLSSGTSSPQSRPEPAIVNFDRLQLVSWKHSVPTAVAWVCGISPLFRYAITWLVYNLFWWAAKFATWRPQQLKRRVCTIQQSRRGQEPPNVSSYNSKKLRGRECRSQCASAGRQSSQQNGFGKTLCQLENWRKDFASVGEGVGPSCNFGMLQCPKVSITKASCHHDCRAYEGLCEAEEIDSEVWANSKAMEPLHVRMSWLMPWWHCVLRSWIQNRGLWSLNDRW